MEKKNYSLRMALIYIIFGGLIGIISYFLGHIIIGSEGVMNTKFLYFEVLGGMLVGLINYIFFYVLAYYLLNNISDLLTKVKHDDLTVRLQYDGKDIFGKVARQVNETLEKLEIADTHLYIDNLTKLENRLGLMRHFDTKVYNQTENRHFVVYLDVDDFKMINDNYGHRVGDLVICEIGKRLKTMLLPNEKGFRLSGDEFIVMISIQQDEDISIYVKKLLSLLNHDIEIDNQTIKMSMSYGVSEYGKCGLEYHSLLEAADNAMYEHKKSKKSKSTINLVHKNDKETNL